MKVAFVATSLALAVFFCGCSKEQDPRAEFVAKLHTHPETDLLLSFLELPPIDRWESKFEDLRGPRLGLKSGTSAVSVFYSANAIHIELSKITLSLTSDKEIDSQDQKWVKKIDLPLIRWLSRNILLKTKNQAVFVFVKPLMKSESSHYWIMLDGKCVGSCFCVEGKLRSMYFYRSHITKYVVAEKS